MKLYTFAGNTHALQSLVIARYNGIEIEVCEGPPCRALFHPAADPSRHAAAESELLPPRAFPSRSLPLRWARTTNRRRSWPRARWARCQCWRRPRAALARRLRSRGAVGSFAPPRHAQARSSRASDLASCRYVARMRADTNMYGSSFFEAGLVDQVRRRRDARCTHAASTPRASSTPAATDAESGAAPTSRMPAGVEPAAVDRVRQERARPACWHVDLPNPRVHQLQRVQH